MPIIDGYDDLELGPAGFPDGLTRGASVTSCKYETGTTKAGNRFYALDVVLTAGSTSEKLRVWIPCDTDEWRGWSVGRRKATKGQLTALGIDISEVESEQARGAVIGRVLDVEVDRNGQYRNVYLREPVGTDAASFPSPTVPLEGAAVVNATAGRPEAIVV